MKILEKLLLVMEMIFFFFKNEIKSCSSSSILVCCKINLLNKLILQQTKIELEEQDFISFLKKKKKLFLNFDKEP